MADDVFECWADVPGTGARFQVSNRGHLRAVGKKERRSGRTRLAFVNEPKALVCDYKTGRLGWWVFFDMAKAFLPRDELMALFPEAVRDVDRSLDEEARRRRDETYMEPDVLHRTPKAGKETKEE